jgi:hypothetical protein
LLPFCSQSFVFHLLSKFLKIKTYKTIILPVVLYGLETSSLTLRKEQRMRMFENSVKENIWTKEGGCGGRLEKTT